MENVIYNELKVRRYSIMSNHHLKDPNLSYSA